MHLVHESFPYMVISDSSVCVLASEGLDYVKQFKVLRARHRVVELHAFHTEFDEPTSNLGENKLILGWN
jgi:hypothetical protein